MLRKLISNFSINFYCFYFLFTRHPEASVSATFAASESNMYKWRQKNLPLKVDSLSAFSNLINSDEFKHLITYEGGSLNVSSVVGVDLDTSLVFVDLDFGSQVCENCNLYIDATFKIVPAVNNVYQFLILKAEIFNEVSKYEISKVILKVSLTGLFIIII